MASIDDLALWMTRMLWVGLAIVASGPLGEALAGRSRPVQIVAALGLWAAWTVTFGALLVPRSSGLTVTRVLVPAGLAASAAALLTGADVSPRSVASVAIAAAALVAVLMPSVGEWFVDGSSYGPEHRLPLRAPILFAAVVAPATWLLVIAGAVTGPLLLASQRWVLGAVAVVVGAAVVVVGCRSLHQLSRRWVVLVPTGLVIHDVLTMPEPQLFLRTSIRRLGPAPADADGQDLTAGAAGLALRMELSEPADLVVRTKGRTTTRQDANAVLFTPSRPNRLLTSAGERKIPIG